MEKFHKYCLSVLLVIVYSNISAHTNNESIKNIDFKQFQEIYSQFLNYEFDDSQEFCLNEESACSFAIHNKQNAADLIGNSILEKQQNNPYYKKWRGDFSSKEKHQNILINFEKQNKRNDFADHIDLKSKVAKIRNKDDLNIKK
ncbi:hypothetical protein [Chryseobacterium chendengshani]|uniref:hypothetical protein n=1 Tax=Chryseobacterium sp. LJ756 TaxID=2864113 RepID=UPI001C63C004|nr:hypothetical protein [Chryseobacterium sp. LJ756]MBW7675178.1 hypothetical protein [Chryseobacterium sp. LJ756]